MSGIRDRAFAGFGAILFLVTSSALTIAVIISLISNGNSSGTTAPNTTSNSTSNTASTANQTSSTANSTSTSVPTTKLAGTQLANFTPITSVPSLVSTDTTVGSGATVKTGDTVTVDYTGAVASTGTIFQSSKDSGQPVTFPLNEVIEGWQKGLPGMKVGGTRRLLIPAAEGYGAKPPSGSGIPANANLVFDITLDKID